ncbi:uncharacterized protein LOC116425843 [Nomia melanderi]|uniref:uncharacterized protein LOC116425843 n=1 Tax=Nomia melanderi TaxID=2448451 RepID=UPI00130411F9|nr:uncharacterized protein LOC116425843 [Nomia melanderi]
MFEGIVWRHFPLYLLVNVVLVAGSPGIYSSDLARSHRHASCPSCSRDCPAALANWNAAPYARGVQAETARWPSGERPFEPSQPSLLSNPYSLNPSNPYGRAPGSGGAPAINRSAGGTCRRENPFAFKSRDLDTDLAPAPAAVVHGLNAPVAPYQSRGLANLARPFNKAGFYDLIKRQSIPPANNEHLRYDSLELGPPLFEDPKTKLSVVYRADKYDDGSNEDAPLYPLDYPARKMADRRPGVRRQVGVQVNGADRLGQPEQDQSRDSRLASGSNYEGQSRDFGMLQGLRFAQKDEPRNSRMTDRFAQTRDQSRDPSDIRGFINPQDQPSDFGADQRFIQPQEDSSGDFKMDGGFIQPGEDESREPGMEYGFMNPQENQSGDIRKAEIFAQPQDDQLRDSRMTDRFNQEDQTRGFRMDQRFVQPQDQLRDSRMTGRLNQEQTNGFRMDQRFDQPQDQLRDSRMTAGFNQPGDPSRNPSVIPEFINPQDQTSGFRMDQRFVQEDQSRDPRTTDRFTQREEDRSRDPSLIQVPEVRYDFRDLASNFNVMKLIHQMGAMLRNHSSLEDRTEEKNSREVEKQGGQRESQVIQKINGGDQGNKGVDPREKQLQEEVKEKRGAADRKITADDQLDWSGAELVPFQTTTELPVLDLTNIETMG